VVTELFSTPPPTDAKGWRDARDPKPLLEHLKELTAAGGRTDLLRVLPGRRKARHFAAACCRRVEHLVRFPALAALMGKVEDYAEGRVRIGELLAEKRRVELTDRPETAEPTVWDVVYRGAHRLGDSRLLRPTPADRLAHGACLKAAGGNSAEAVDCWESAAEAAANAGADLYAELAVQADLVRDLFGNPFEPVGFDPAWRTSSALDLARSAYASGDFSVLPILADALQEAGCDDPAVLGHCRDAAVHARGCWVVDAVLGL
jgi:hypothetical protein